MQFYKKYINAEKAAWNKDEATMMLEYQTKHGSQTVYFNVPRSKSIRIGSVDPDFSDASLQYFAESITLRTA